MFVFAHVGITIGTACTVSGIINKRAKLHGKQLPGSDKIPFKNNTAEKTASVSKRIGLSALSRFLDIRVLMVGALVPDIIDKPLSLFGFGNGRSITHTLLIFLIALSIGLYVYKYYKRTWPLAIVTGILTHLILDSMWARPQTLLWPLYGWAFPVPNHRVGLGQINIWWHALISDPGVYIWEAIGIFILAAFTVIIIHENRFKTFLMKGRIYKI
jgi:membrane-bound metal-dependent hydrolase YbcI (DUF457 family)